MFSCCCGLDDAARTACPDGERARTIDTLRDLHIGFLIRVKRLSELLYAVGQYRPNHDIGRELHGVWVTGRRGAQWESPETESDGKDGLLRKNVGTVTHLPGGRTRGIPGIAQLEQAGLISPLADQAEPETIARVAADLGCRSVTGVSSVTTTSPRMAAAMPAAQRAPVSSMPAPGAGDHVVSRCGCSSGRPEDACLQTLQGMDATSATQLPAQLIKPVCNHLFAIPGHGVKSRFSFIKNAVIDPLTDLQCQ